MVSFQQNAFPIYPIVTCVVLTSSNHRFSYPRMLPPLLFPLCLPEPSNPYWHPAITTTADSWRQG